MLRSLEDFGTTLERLEASNIVTAAPVLVQRLDQLEESARGEEILVAMIEKLRCRLVDRKDLDG